jgi:O-antigen/teichoic acid export membrane protein
MFILSIGLAAIQFSDRYIVANLLPKASLPSFVYASLIYVPLWAAISSVLITLWPHFTSLQINLEPSIVRKKVQQLWGSVVLIGVALGIAFAVTAPFVIQLVSSGLVEVNLAVIYAFSLLLIVQIAQFPIGVYLVDNAGLRFQAFFVSIAAIMCIPLSSVLVSSIGASGSVLASASLIVIFQLLPNTLRFARKQEIKSREIHDK